MSNSLDPDQGGHSVDPDLGSNCLESLGYQQSRLARKEFNHPLEIQPTLIQTS